MKPIYLDYNATTPVDPRVAKAMLPYLQDRFGNPSSGHSYGQETNEAVKKARGQMARMLGCQTNELAFTSGGSESNNLAIKGIIGACGSKGNHIITTNVEHPAIYEVCEFLKETAGCEISYLPVDKHGLISPKQVAEAITEKTALITVMHANNEVGTIEPIAEIAELAHQHNIIVHTDAAQSVGKVPVKVNDLKVDLLSVAGHKVYAPKGIGALYVRDGVELQKQIHGAGQESGLRAGTENVLEIVGLGEAADIIGGYDSLHFEKMQKHRDRLQNELTNKFGESCRVNGHLEKRLVNTLSISFKNIKANELLANMDSVAASAGAACHSDDVKVSHVLEAMQVPLEFAMGTLRLSVGRFTTEEDIDQAILEIEKAVNRLK